MTRTLVASGAAAIAVLALAGTAEARHARHHATYAAPPQPVPYTQLDRYLNASPAERAAILSGARTGTATDTAASLGPTSGVGQGATGTDSPTAAKGSELNAVRGDPQAGTVSPNGTSTGEATPPAAPAGDTSTPRS